MTTSSTRRWRRPAVGTRIGDTGSSARPPLDTIASFDELETHSVLRLLKLHGSINWRPKLGYASPVAIDSITHHHDWAGISLRHPQVGGHLEPEPVMVPPVLSRSCTDGSAKGFSGPGGHGMPVIVKITFMRRKARHDQARC